ncbi:hypothetical protein W823_18365 [Williamsia sp. D3]|nr:hypothetical protein W823_18365 [Williamsia sp. D3]
MRSRLTEHQRAEQRESQHRAEDDLDGELPRGQWGQAGGPGELGAREGERPGRDHGHDDRARPDPAQHPRCRCDNQFGEHQTGDEPRHMTRKPVLGLDTLCERELFGHPRPRQTDHRHRQQDGNPPPCPRTAQPHQEPREQRQQQIKTDLDRQTPHLRQSGRQRQWDVHLGEGEIGQPHRRACGARVREQAEHHHHDHHVCGPDPENAVTQVPGQAGDPGGRIMGRRGMWPPQQEAGEREEQGHRHVEATPDRTEYVVAHRTRLEGDVGGQYTDGRQRPHSLERGDEALGLLIRTHDQPMYRWPIVLRPVLTCPFQPTSAVSLARNHQLHRSKT